MKKRNRTVTISEDQISYPNFAKMQLPELKKWRDFGIQGLQEAESGKFDDSWSKEDNDDFRSLETQRKEFSDRLKEQIAEIDKYIARFETN